MRSSVFWGPNKHTKEAAKQSRGRLIVQWSDIREVQAYTKALEQNEKDIVEAAKLKMALHDLAGAEAGAGQSRTGGGIPKGKRAAPENGSKGPAGAEVRGSEGGARPSDAPSVQGRARHGQILSP